MKQTILFGVFFFAASGAMAWGEAFSAKCLIEARCRGGITVDDEKMFDAAEKARVHSENLFGRAPTCEEWLKTLDESPNGRERQIRWHIQRFERFQRTSCLQKIAL